MIKHFPLKIMVAIFLLAGIFAVAAGVIASSAESAGLNTGAGPWQWLKPPVQGASVNDVSYVDADTGWAVGIGGMILRTTDGGENWSSLPSGTNYNLWAVDFADANNGWAVGEYGTIIHTSDGGDSWEAQTNTVSGSAWFSSVSFANANTGVAVGGDYIYYTNNGGANWYRRDIVASLDSLNSVYLVDANTGYAVGTPGAVYKTIDGGQNWTEIDPGVTSPLTGVHFSDSNHGFAVAFITTLDSPPVLYGRIVRTDDGGATWEANSGQIVSTALTDLQVTGGGTTLTTSGNNGALFQYETTGDNLWSTPIDDVATALIGTPKSSGTTANILALDFPTDLVGYAGGTAGVVSKTTDGGDNWILKSGGDPVSFSDSSFIDAENGWFVGTDGNAIATSDTGETWTTNNTDIPTDADLQGVHFLDANTGVAVGCQGADCPYSGTAVAYQYDGDGSWTSMTVPGGIVSLNSVHMTDATHGWAVGDDGVALTTSDGVNWVSTATGLTADMNLISVDSIDGDPAFAVCEKDLGGGSLVGNILKYESGSGSWTALEPTDAPGILASVDMYDETTGYVVGSQGKIYKTTTGGITTGDWIQQTSGTGMLLADVSFSDANYGFAVGEQGRLIHTNDGGAKWFAEDIGTNVSMQTVSTVGERQAYIGGGNASILKAVRAYYFTWYDNLGGDNWVLMANPESAPQDVTYELFIDGLQRDISGAGDAQYAVLPGDSITPRFNTMGGPVNAASVMSNEGLVSQRSLWPKGGSSIEEIMGVDIERLSDHFYWTYYDQNAAGFQNWVMVSNPNPYAVNYEVKIGGVSQLTDSIPAGESATPWFPGVAGGPVEVIATTSNGAPAQVMASQRVLSGGGTAFNEALGIPEEELSDHYIWTWYDQENPSAMNWVQVANTNAAATVYYEIDIADGCANPTPDNACQTGTLSMAGQAGDIVSAQFPGIANGPVEVQAWTLPDRVTPADVIASQRVTWGSSFGETTGFPYENLNDTYHWTWYDQNSTGMLNWVLIANPSESETIDVEIWMAGEQCEDGVGPSLTPTTWTLDPGERATPDFGNYIGGPVEVRAYVSGTGTPIDVIASQRVLNSGYFNEVVGAVLN